MILLKITDEGPGKHRISPKCKSFVSMRKLTQWCWLELTWNNMHEIEHMHRKCASAFSDIILKMKQFFVFFCFISLSWEALILENIPKNEWKVHIFKSLYWFFGALEIPVRGCFSKDVMDVVLLSLLLSLNRLHTLFWCFHCWVWTSKCQLLQKVTSAKNNCCPEAYPALLQTCKMEDFALTVNG